MRDRHGRWDVLRNRLRCSAIESARSHYGDDDPWHRPMTSPVSVLGALWGDGRVAQPFGFRPHRSERAAFPHSAPPEVERGIRHEPGGDA